MVAVVVFEFSGMRCQLEFPQCYIGETLSGTLYIAT